MRISILGTRGVPARHGGFETFAEQLSLYLVGRGHEVTVYCQTGEMPSADEDYWLGVRRIWVRGGRGAKGTITFDWAATCHALGEDSLILTLGYNTAVFSLLYRLRGRVTLMNMDGIEWKRQKWSPLERLWLRLNERAGAWLSTHLIADHPLIERRLARFAAREKISMIPYGADAIEDAGCERVVALGLIPGEYALVIARPEPENSILDVVRGFCCKPRGRKLVILGAFHREIVSYHREVMEAANNEVIFLGAIYDREVMSALRYFARVYLHGHRVGGTNPSLVESLASGNPILAHDNAFNRWVAGPDAGYFTDAEHLSTLFDRLLEDKASLSAMAAASRARHGEMFRQEMVMEAYERVFQRFAGANEPSHATEAAGAASAREPRG